jgi:hypothetical protein
MTLTSFAYFWGLCVAQGAIVLGPGALRSSWLAALRARWLWLAVPAAAVTASTFLPPVASMLGVGLSTLALVLVPPLAVLGIGWAMRWPDRRLVPLVPALFAVGWASPGSLVGQAALLLIVSLSCVALAVVVVAIVPRAVAKAGIVVWAAADLSLALAHGLERASHAITHAAPAVGPHLQLQRVVLGPASIEFADLFVAAALGAVLAAESRNRGLASLMVAVLAIALGAFLLVTSIVPGTVPVAAALAVEELRYRRAETGGRPRARARFRRRIASA